MEKRDKGLCLSKCVAYSLFFIHSFIHSLLHSCGKNAASFPNHQIFVPCHVTTTGLCSVLRVRAIAFFGGRKRKIGSIPKRNARGRLVRGGSGCLEEVTLGGNFEQNSTF